MRFSEREREVWDAVIAELRDQRSVVDAGSTAFGKSAGKR